MIVAHDLGTTGNKASLHDDQGRTLAAVTVDYPANFAAGAWPNRTPSTGGRRSEPRPAACSTSPACRAPPSKVVGLSGQMMGAVFLDEAHRPVRPAMIWADHRSTAQADRLLADVGQGAAYARLGHRIHPTYTLAKMMWVATTNRTSGPGRGTSAWPRTSSSHRLTGRSARTPRTPRPRSLRPGCRSSGRLLLDAAGIAAGFLPALVDSTAVVGGLTPPRRAPPGSPASTPVVLGGGDSPIAAVGAGVITPADGAYVCLGSSVVDLRLLHPAAPRPADALDDLRHVVAGRRAHGYHAGRRRRACWSWISSAGRRRVPGPAAGGRARSGRPTRACLPALPAG